MPGNNPKTNSFLIFQSAAIALSCIWGEVESQRIADHLFEGLVNGDWMIRTGRRSGGYFLRTGHCTSDRAQSCHIPTASRSAQLHNVDPLFKGFSAIYHQKGWVFVNAASDINERNYHIHLLTFHWGCTRFILVQVRWLHGLQQLIFEALLPFGDDEELFQE